METLLTTKPLNLFFFAFPTSIPIPPSHASTLSLYSHKTHYKLSASKIHPHPHPNFATPPSHSHINIPTTPTLLSHPRPRRNRRSNSLRKKLTHDLRHLHHPHHPSLHHFLDTNNNNNNHNNNNQTTQSNLPASLELDNAKMGANSQSQEGEEAGFGDDSHLWNKLEGWVEQYKKDTQYWGIGSNPIFTIYQSSHGDVHRVLVDDTEILRRSGVYPLQYRDRDATDSQDFNQLNSKISHAHFLAKEIECGRLVLSNNSSIAKFVTTGAQNQNSGFLTNIISFPRTSILPKLSRVAAPMACGFLFLWVINKLRTTLVGNEREVTRFEKEMLRRKIKSRMEKEKLYKGSVEVVEQPSDPDYLNLERPSLDKDELLDSIRKAKGLLDNDGINNGEWADASHQDNIASAEMDAKIQKIQIMANHAREIETGECPCPPPVEMEVGESNDKTTMMHMVQKTAPQRPADSGNIDESKSQTSDEKLPEMHSNSLNDQSNDFITEPRSPINGIMTRKTFGDQYPGSSDAPASSNLKLSQKNENFKPHMGGEKRLNNNHTTSSDVSSSQLQPSLKNMPVRKKPKIILSVKEAREYLSQKHLQKPQLTNAPTTTTTTNEGTEDHMTHLAGEYWREPRSYGGVDRISEPIQTADISGSSSVKANPCLADDIDKLNGELLMKLKLNGPSDSGGGVQGSMHGNMYNSNDVSDVLGENAFHAARVEEGENLPIEQCLDKADDELPKYTNLVEIPKLEPEIINSSLDAGISSEASAVSGDTSLDEVSEINGTLGPVNLVGSTALITGASDLHGSSSDKSAILPVEKNHDRDYRKGGGEAQLQNDGISLDFGKNTENMEEQSSADKEKWLEKNFHEVEPVVKKIGAGFRNSYMVARDKVKQEDMTLDCERLRSIMDNDTELEWMQDGKLRDIVFRVRENELAGRDPFYSMDPDDKVSFLTGLEKKVEKENERLSTLHEWLHSNIENVDYGADGISLYDPPEKVLPRWKGPPIDKIPEFLANTAGQEVASFLQEENESQQHDLMVESQETSSTKSRQNAVAKTSKTVIEASDGSIKPGKKSKKEYWQHTKKWSRGFVESYNTETDPEVKSVMKNMGKDLDRWITEKEIQETADLMDKIPQRGKEYIEKKLNKLKREMEQFGPAAVVSKYREYAEEKEEDYLWWLDLRYVLCIELYTYEGEDQRVGFYSLEMAADLELDPKPRHVVAFEDASDCKNFCYIIQAHLEMLGSGQAFVVAQPPKDVFWQAKENGFGVTVIRKGELTLNVDLPLEEVEESIAEIGSKMYHDKIMRERSVDISMLMKGVFGFSKPPKRRRKKRGRKIIGK